MHDSSIKGISMNTQHPTKERHTKIKTYSYLGFVSILLLLLSMLFVTELYSTMKLVDQIYVVVTAWIILNMVILPGFSNVQEKLKVIFVKTQKRKCLGYLLYIVTPPMLFNGLLYRFTFVKGLSDFFIFILIPTFIMLLISITERIPKKIRKSYWVDILFVLFYFYTFDARLFNNTFNVLGGPSYNILSLYMVSVLIYVFLFLRNRESIGFNLEINKRDLAPWIGNLVMFTVIAIPIAIFTGFIIPRNVFESPLLFIIYFIGIFLTIGLIEEFAFRGILLNFIEQATGNKVMALIISAILFGISHYNNATPWDVRYIGLATIAGIFYGLSYLKQRRLLPAILVHTSVDTIWKYFFY